MEFNIKVICHKRNNAPIPIIRVKWGSKPQSPNWSLFPHYSLLPRCTCLFSSFSALHHSLRAGPCDCISRLPGIGLNLANGRRKIGGQEGISPDISYSFFPCSGSTSWAAGGSFHENTSHWVNFFPSDTLSFLCLFLPRESSGLHNVGQPLGSWLSFICSRNPASHPMPPLWNLPATQVCLFEPSGVNSAFCRVPALIRPRCALSFVISINCECPSKSSVLFVFFTFWKDWFKALYSMSNSQSDQMFTCVLF